MAVIQSKIDPNSDNFRANWREMLALCEAGRLDHWRVERGNLPKVASYVVDTIRTNHPSLDIPFHARWRHFAAAGKDRWGELDAKTRWPSKAHRARAVITVQLQRWPCARGRGSLISRGGGIPEEDPNA